MSHYSFDKVHFSWCSFEMLITSCCDFMNMFKMSRMLRNSIAENLNDVFENSANISKIMKLFIYSVINSWIHAIHADLSKQFCNNWFGSVLDCLRVRTSRRMNLDVLIIIMLSWDTKDVQRMYKGCTGVYRHHAWFLWLFKTFAEFVAKVNAILYR